MPQLPSQWNNDVQAVSMQPVSGNPEYVIPLWWSSGTQINIGSASIVYVLKGSTSSGAISNSAAKLHTLNSNWSASTQYALEVAINASAAGTVYIELWDVVGNVAVAGTSITTSATTSTVLRTAKFSLVSGKSYALGAKVVSGAVSVLVTDASLIVFPQ